MTDDNPNEPLNRQEVDAKLAGAEAKARARESAFEIAVKAGFAELKIELIELRGALNARIDATNARIDHLTAEVFSRLDKVVAELVKWVLGVAIGLALIMIGAVNMVLSQLDRRQTAVHETGSSTAPQPIIIYVQPPGHLSTVVPPAVAPAK